MDNYTATIRLIGLKDQNLPPFKDMRLQRINSVQRIINLIRVAERTRPQIPSLVFNLNPEDPEWDDDMVYPKVNYFKFMTSNIVAGAMVYFYAVNFNVIGHSVRFRHFRNAFPILVGAAYGYVW